MEDFEFSSLTHKVLFYDILEGMGMKKGSASKLLYRNCSSPESAYELVFHNVQRPKVEEHSHDFAELFWMKEGRCLHVWNGESRELRANDFIVLNPKDRHSFEMIDGLSFKVVNLAFGPSTLPRLAKRYALPADSVWSPNAAGLRLLKLSAEDGAWLDAEFKRLRGRKPSPLSLEGFLIALMLRLGEGRPDNLASLPEWLRDAMLRMSRPENFRQGPRRLQELAGRGLAHISRILKERTGRGPSQWVSEWRMAYAAERLESGNAQVDEIIVECGFSSKSRFHKLFLEKFKLSPRRYRLRQRSIFPTR